MLIISAIHLLAFVKFTVGRNWMYIDKAKAVPITGLEWPGGFQEVKVPRFHDNGTGCW
jgi:hypothetical protein